MDRNRIRDKKGRRRK